MATTGGAGRFAVQATSAASAHLNPLAYTVEKEKMKGTSCRWLCGGPEHMLRGNLLLAGLALSKAGT